MSQGDNIVGKRLLFSLFGLCIILVSLTFFALSINKPYLGIEFSKNAQGWVVKAVDATGLAKSRGINVGDKPAEINGQPAQIFLDKYDQDGMVWGLFISELTVVDIQGQSKSVVLEGSSPPAPSIIELASWLVVCIVFWIIGYFVFLKKPKNTAALLLYISGIILGLSFSANMGAARSIPTASYLSAAAALIGPWLLVHFFLFLPEESTRLHSNPRVYLIYLPAVITIVLFLLIGYHDGQPVLWFRSLRLLESGTGFAIAAGIAIFNYTRAISIRTRQ